MKTYLVIDVGGTNIKYALMKEDLSFVDKGEIETPKTNLDDFVNALVLLYEERKEHVDGIAFSLPGLIDSTKGYMYTGGALSHYLINVNLVDMIQTRTGVPVTIENDGKCAALAELWKGSLQGVDIGMVLTVGTGIGGGLVVGGKLVRGVNFAAGEISSLPVTIQPKNDPFKFWAQINGTPALLTAYQEAKKLKEPVNGRQFFEAHAQGDEVAIQVLKGFAQSFALAIFSLQTVLDGDTYAIGGGISSQASFIQAIRDGLDGFYAQFDNRLPIQKPKVVACTFYNDSNLIGALYHHLELNA
jgi:predicted NBD/HSP70 family sugar kinase